MQSVIVYRNPMEAAFWEMAMRGEFFVVMVGVAVFFAVFLTLNHLVSARWGQRGRAAQRRSYAMLAVSAVAAVAVVNYMWI